ncbi:MAG: hypothetical protein LBU91_01395 [Bacteroidales bacterium]|jgi:hypothetical protein|nr:hypothetical protein [Bacteroidales bacterium]
MIINLHNYESILIDYLDGTLSATDRAVVDLFLQQNPDIAEQVSGLADVVLIKEDLNYEQKSELEILTKSDDDFAQWESQFPKLPVADVVYPHKTKLYRFEKRQQPRWVWVAAAACLAVAIWFFVPKQASNDFEDGGLAQGNEELKIKNEELKESTIENNKQNDVKEDAVARHVKRHRDIPTKQANSSTEDHAPRTSHPAPDFLAAITPISMSVPNERLLAEKTETLFPEIIELDETSSHLSRLDAVAGHSFFDPMRSVIHTASRIFYERKNDVDMFVEQSELAQKTIQYFAQR